MYIAKTTLQNAFCSATFHGSLDRGFFHWHSDANGRREDRAFIENGICVRYDTRWKKNGVWGDWGDEKTSGGCVDFVTKCLESIREWGWTLNQIWTEPCPWPRRLEV